MNKYKLAILFAMLFSFNATAASVTTFMFTGVVNSITDKSSVLNGEVSVGTAFTGYFTYRYDPSIPEASSFSGDPTVAFYPVITDTRLDIGGLSIESTVSSGNTTQKVQIWDNKNSGWPHMDAFSVSSGLDYTPPFNLGSGKVTASYTASFWDTSGTLISSDILPSPEQIVMSNFDRNSFSFIGLNHDQYWAYQDGLATSYTSLHINGNILTVQAIQTVPVPEASTYAMMLAGLGLVATAVRRRRM